MWTWIVIGLVVFVAIVVWNHKVYVKGGKKYMFRATIRADRTEKWMSQIGEAWERGTLTDSLLAKAEEDIEFQLKGQRAENGPIAMAGGHRDSYAKMMEFSLAKVKDLRYNGGRRLQEIAEDEEEFAIAGIQATKQQVAETRSNLTAWGVDPPSWMQETSIPQQSTPLRAPTPEEAASIEMGRQILNEVVGSLKPGDTLTLADICYGVHQRSHGLIDLTTQAIVVETVYQHIGGEDTPQTKDGVKKLLQFMAEQHSQPLQGVSASHAVEFEESDDLSADEDDEEPDESVSEEEYPDYSPDSEIGQLISSIQYEVSESEPTILEVCRLVENESPADWSVRKRASIVLSAVVISTRDDLDTQRSLLEWAFDRIDEEWSDDAEMLEDRDFTGTDKVLRARLDDPVVGATG